MKAWCCLLLVMACVATGCSEQGPQTREDDPGNTGYRIVSLSPAATVMLRDMGHGGSIVGRHGWDAIADPGVRVVGDQTGLDYEALLGVAPTHVVLEWGSRDPPPRLLDLAAQRGFGIVHFRTLTLGDLAASAALLRDTFGGPEADDVVNTVISLRETPEGASAQRRSLGRVLLVVASSPAVDCLGPGSAHHQILEAAGFDASLEEGGPWMTLGAEDIARLDPDAIVFVQPREGGASPTIEQRLGPLASLDIAAVRHSRVVVIDDPLSLIPSSSLARFRSALERGLDALGPLPSPRDDEPQYIEPGNDKPGPR